MVLGRVEKLRLVTDTDEGFEDLSVCAFELQEMATDHAVRALQVLEYFHLAAFHEKNAVKLGLDGIQVLK